MDEPAAQNTQGHLARQLKPILHRRGGRELFLQNQRVDDGQRNSEQRRSLIRIRPVVAVLVVVVLELEPPALGAADEAHVSMLIQTFGGICIWICREKLFRSLDSYYSVT